MEGLYLQCVVYPASLPCLQLSQTLGRESMLHLRAKSYSNS